MSVDHESSEDPDGGQNLDVARTYARHIEEAQNILQEGSTSLETIEKVRGLLEASSVLCKKERTVQETILGGAALSICAQISKNQAQSLDTNLCAFDSNIYQMGIQNAIRDPEIENGRPDWKRLAKKAKSMFKRAPTFSYLYGSFKPTEPPPKVPKERSQKTRRTADAGEKKKPEKIQTVEASDEGNDKAVMRMKKVLEKEFAKRNSQPISYFECVLHPTSFSHTVENMFHLCFLIKDNFIRLDSTPDSVPMICLVPIRESDKAKSSKKRQCIISISEAQWKELVKVFQVTNPMIP